MGFGNGYDTGYADGEADTRRKIASTVGKIRKLGRNPTVDEVVAKVNEVIGALKKAVPLVAAAGVLFAAGAETKARLGDLTPDSLVVTESGSSGPTGIVSKPSIEWQANGNAIDVSVAANGILTANLEGWTEGQTVLAFITVQTGAQVDDAVKTIGYSQIQPGVRNMCACVRVGNSVYVNVIASFPLDS